MSVALDAFIEWHYVNDSSRRMDLPRVNKRGYGIKDGCLLQQLHFYWYSDYKGALDWRRVNLNETLTLISYECGLLQRGWANNDTLTSYIIVSPSQWHHCHCSNGRGEEKEIIDQSTIAGEEIVERAQRDARVLSLKKQILS